MRLNYFAWAFFLGPFRDTILVLRGWDALFFPVSGKRSKVLKEDTDIHVPFLSIQRLDLRVRQNTKFSFFSEEFFF